MKCVTVGFEEWTNDAGALHDSCAKSDRGYSAGCMAKRILVLSASVGAGHMRAAQAVELALRELAPAAHVENVDVLTLTNSVFRRLYGSAYLDLVNKAPHVLGYFYDMMDRPR